jgi:hypothetical protein
MDVDYAPIESLKLWPADARMPLFLFKIRRNRFPPFRHKTSHAKRLEPTAFQDAKCFS